MTPFEVSTANEAWGTVVEALRRDDVASIQGRGGATREILNAVVSIANPCQRWMVSRLPAMNPAFAIAEVIWMLRGRKDSGFINSWNSQYKKFAGADATYHGAYGHRLTKHFGTNQLLRAYDALRHDPASRQVVLQVWDAATDLPDEQGRPVAADIPCNVCSILKVRGGRLEWLQVMRSNDVFLGFPHNVIQWTSLQEVLAGWLGIGVGTYVHVANSLHVYEKDLSSIGVLACEESHNNDSLAVPKEQSDYWFAELERRIEQMSADKLTQSGLEDLLNLSGAPRSFANLLLIMGAESARKRNWPDLAQHAIDLCTNPALQQVWIHWRQRVGDARTPAP